MFSRRTHKSINSNEFSSDRKVNLEQNVLHSRIKQSNFKLLSLNHLKKKTLGNFLSKFKAVNVRGGVSAKFKKHSSLPLDSNKTKNKKLSSSPNLLKTNQNITASESNICEKSFKTSIVNLICLDQNNEANLGENNSIIEYLLKYNDLKPKNRLEEENPIEDKNESNDEINSSIVIHSDSSGTEEENQTFVVLTDSDEELPSKIASEEQHIFFQDQKSVAKQISVIPEWLQNYANSSSTNESFSIPWNNFNLEQLNLTDFMLQRIFNIECEQIILKYDKYRNILNSRLNQLHFNNKTNI